MKLLSSDSDVNILYAYACLGAKCRTFGLSLAASRSHIVIRDDRSQVVVQERTIEEAECVLQRQIDDGHYEYLKRPTS